MDPQQHHIFPQYQRQMVGIMTEEQMQVLQLQIAAFAELQEQLCNWYLSLSSFSSPPVDHPNIVDPDPDSYAHKLARRKRWNPTPEQLEALEQFGKEIKMNPNKEDLRMLAADLVKHGEITESNVYNWYQNRRARLRKKERQQQNHPINNDDNDMASEMGNEAADLVTDE